MSKSNDKSDSHKVSQAASLTPGLDTLEKKFKRVKKIVEEATDIREERVAAIKRCLERGELNLNGKDLAGKILADPLNQVDIEI